MNKKKPSNIKKLQGTYRKHREINEVEFEPITNPADIDCPIELNEYGRKLWNDQLPEVCASGLIHKAGIMSFAAYCNEWGTYCEMEEAMKKMGSRTHTERNEDGTIKRIIKLPHNNISNAAFQNAMKMGSEFGVTPASKAKVPAPKRQKADPLTEHLKRKQNG